MAESVEDKIGRLCAKTRSRSKDTVVKLLRMKFKIAKREGPSIVKFKSNFRRDRNSVAAGCMSEVIS